MRPKSNFIFQLIIIFVLCNNVMNPITYSLVKESAANVKESAAAQLRLWRECMRRYETVARDVGDTDARLMVGIG